MITYDDAKRTLLELVEEKGANYVYESPFEDGDCVYSTSPDDGAYPSCIVGHVVAKLDPEVFKRIVDNEWSFMGVQHEDQDGNITFVKEWVSTSGAASTLMTENPDAFDVEDDRLNYLLSVAQTVQDNGGTWGTAVRKAIESAEPGV